MYILGGLILMAQKHPAVSRLTHLEWIGQLDRTVSVNCYESSGNPLINLTTELKWLTT